MWDVRNPLFHLWNTDCTEHLSSTSHTKSKQVKTSISSKNNKKYWGIYSLIRSMWWSAVNELDSRTQGEQASHTMLSDFHRWGHSSSTAQPYYKCQLERSNSQADLGQHLFSLQKLPFSAKYNFYSGFTYLFQISNSIQSNVHTIIPFFTHTKHRRVGSDSSKPWVVAI